MCGIAGVLGYAGNDAKTLVAKMASALSHRGPDDAGVWIDSQAGVAFGHRRLAVVDLSPAGHQPMVSASGRYVICFNGEIYNHQLLRRELAKCGHDVKWRGQSDTETVLAAMECWGVVDAITRLTGMFAIAVWDNHQRSLYLIRDRAGEKPLYYGLLGRSLIFASDLKAFKMHPEFRGELDRSALCSYLRFSYVPDPLSIYKSVQKLPPGSFLKIAGDCELPNPRRYWSSRPTGQLPSDQRHIGTDGDVLAALESRIAKAVAGQMIADVPLGAFLSGGIDSSLIVSLMQEQSRARVRTFTIGFEDKSFDEAPYARAVAAHIGTDHTELYVSASDALRLVPLMPTVFDEPFGDASQIPTYLVTKLARQSVTVCLSGDAGDELFGGYYRYFWSRRIWRSIRLMPPVVRRVAAGFIAGRTPEYWNGLERVIACVLRQSYQVRMLGDKMLKLAPVLHSGSRQQLYRSIVSHWPEPADIVLGGLELPGTLDSLLAADPGSSFEQDMMDWDFSTYLPGDILVKVDRAAMAHSLETRVPLLDHDVVEFAAKLPLRFKIRAGVGKWALRQLLYKRVPRELIDRPKMGFGVPIGSWLRGPLREWAEELLDESRLNREAIFVAQPIRERWVEHCSGRRDWSYWLWDVLMFQAWNVNQR